MQHSCFLPFSHEHNEAATMGSGVKGVGILKLGSCQKALFLIQHFMPQGLCFNSVKLSRMVLRLRIANRFICIDDDCVSVHSQSGNFCFQEHIRRNRSRDHSWSTARKSPGKGTNLTLLTSDENI